MNRIGIIGAMDEEIDVFKEEMEIKEVKSIANIDFYIGNIYGKSVVLVRCGIGKVNAAICTQILISELNVDLVINTGVAGAINDELDVMDIVVSTDVLQHDFDVTGFGYQLGEIPRMDTFIFPADAHLVEKTVSASERVLKNNKVIKGRVVSGDIFVSDMKLKENLLKNFSADCTEMEGAAIGHTCYVNNIPFVVIRAMSDKADGSAGTNYNEFVQEAIANSKEIVKIMLKQI
ncbi:5'-methylthioadenosine/adenosylhomocysteine nucleosidase [Alkaliphilus oremlandii]|uniref:adenosylhomocysteine nucleosidase n=1 Tax=Alkaliphilus oremlandii (strain OhILAs) TaxID=350688 RepID=A8MH69_ALKOO|nr:5'-methylthioadenosine/adenosylhomocysteine nucleosidase [Alkaliphilus oremlandii]ABW18956.1 Adenosylhomocysteine nucleosidase [Alkaliphilus oremlandii OhILAs]